MSKPASPVSLAPAVEEAFQLPVIASQMLWCLSRQPNIILCAHRQPSPSLEEFRKLPPNAMTGQQWKISIMSINGFDKEYHPLNPAHQRYLSAKVDTRYAGKPARKTTSIFTYDQMMTQMQVHQCPSVPDQMRYLPNYVADELRSWERARRLAPAVFQAANPA